MTGMSQAGITNGLLARLSAEDFSLLAPKLERIAVEMDGFLSKANQRIEHVYFPESGIASVTLRSEPNKIEVGIIGREGFAGIPIVLGSESYPYDVFVQIPGVFLRMTASDLREAISQSPTVTALLLRYVQSFLVQASSTAAANGSQTVEDRLARWLLMSHDRVDGDEIRFTHEFMSYMLGVRRPGVTVATHVLEGEGMIKARRGSITILDRAKLLERASDTYGAAEREYARLMPAG